MKQPAPHPFWNVAIMALFLLFSCEPTALEPQDQVPGILKFERSSFELPTVITQSDPGVTGDLDGRVTGHRIPLDFFGYNEFDAYWAQKLNGEVEGRFEVRVFDPQTGTLFQDGQGIVTCMTIESDGKTARLGGEVTASETLPELIGTFAFWTVVDNKGSLDQTTDLVIGVPGAEYRDFHCEVGFHPDDFGGTFQTTTGNIRVEVRNRHRAL